MDARNTKPARRVVTVGEAASIYREARHTRRRNVRRSRQFVSAAACLCPLAALERMLAGTTAATTTRRARDDLAARRRTASGFAR